MNILKKKLDANELDPVSAVSGRLRLELAPVEAQLDEAEGMLVRRAEFEYEQAEGLTRGLGFNERMQRIDTGNQLRRDGLSIKAKALDQMSTIHAQGAGDYRNAGAEMQRELDELRPEYQAMGARIQFLQQRIIDAGSKALGEYTKSGENGGQRDACLNLLERIQNGEDVKIRKVPDPMHPLHRQPVGEVSLADIAGWENMPRKQADKLVREYNEKTRREADQAWADLNRAHDLGITVDKLRHLSPQNGPGEAA